MNQQVRRRLLAGLASNWLSKGASSIIQLIQVPLLLHFWSIPLYGEWMIVTSIPTYLSFSNIGFGSAAGNEMTMQTAQDNQIGALGTFQSCWWLTVALSAFFGLALVCAATLFPISAILHLHAIAPPDAKQITIYLGVSVLLGQLEQLVQSAYTCVGRYSHGSVLKSAVSLAAFAASTIPVILHKGPAAAALVLAIANIGGTIFLCIKIRQDILWINFGVRHASLTTVRKLASPALAFLGFPIGNAFNLQATLLAVGYALGPTAVATFATARTLSRVSLQVIQAVNTAFWPEVSRAWGAQNLALVRTLHRRSCQTALILGTACILASLIGAPWFLEHWTQGRIPPSRSLLTILGLTVALYSLWASSSLPMSATNTHQKIATLYLTATGLTVPLTFFFAQRWGLLGAASSLLLSELAMNFYVLPAAIRMSQDKTRDFWASLIVPPKSLYRDLTTLGKQKILPSTVEPEASN